ncbi:MAG: hypothetical protein ACJAVY_000731 [Marinoscillum sp.]|jgi:hypothetical protein
MAITKIESALTEAKEKLTSLGIEEQLVSEIEWCFGSFAHDQNSDGLFVKAAEALAALEKFKVDNPRKVSKKVLDDLAKAIKS